MAIFGSPFSGLANDRKLTDAELIRAIRFMVAAEYEATQLYMQLADSTDNKLVLARQPLRADGFASLCLARLTAWYPLKAPRTTSGPSS